MPTKKQLSELSKVIATHQANLSRLGEAWGQKICDALDDTDRTLIARLKDLLADVKENYKVNTQKSIDQLAYIRSKIEEIRVRAFVKAEKELRAEAPDLIDNETKWSKRILSELSGEKASRFADLTPKQIDKVLNNGIIQNKPWADWWTYTASADVQRVANVVNSGIVQGFTIDQITRLIMGTKKGGYTDGVLSTTRASARNLARTMCSGLANQAKDEFYRQNDDVVIGVEWLDTLDGRTCPSCAGLSRRRWKTDEPHPVPPIHPSCRCVLLPVTELTDMGEDAPRPKANADFDAEAKRYYEQDHPGKHFDDLAQSTREQYRHKAIHRWEKETGRKAYSQVSGNMTFKDYFEQMSDQQKRDWLGKSRFEMWKSGRYEVSDFIPPYPDKAMTVKQLKAADIAAVNAPKIDTEKKKKEHEEHLLYRKGQRQQAYENRLNRWREQMKSVGLKDEVAEEFLKQYTIEASEIGKPPEIIAAPDAKTHLTKDGKSLVIGRDSKTIKDALKHIENLPHKLKRGTQYRVAKYNRAKKEADLIGAKMIHHPHTANMDLKATNPNFENTTDGIYSNNCQRCVTAYEARRRGINVEALPRTDGYESFSRLFLRDGSVNPDGWTSAYKGAKVEKMSSVTGERSRDKIMGQMLKYGDGSRAIVRVQWKNENSGHVFIAEQHNGVTKFIDPQNNDTDVSRYFSQIKPDKTYLVRIDNLKFAENVRKCCKPK